MRKGFRINQKQRNRATKRFHALGTFHDAIPLDDLFRIVEEETGCFVADEAGEPWSGFLCGRQSTDSLGNPAPCCFDLYDKETKTRCVNSQLVLSWYKMEHSGRYEIVTYLG